MGNYVRMCIGSVTILLNCLLQLLNYEHKSLKALSLKSISVEVNFKTLEILNNCYEEILRIYRLRNKPHHILDFNRRNSQNIFKFCTSF